MCLLDVVPIKNEKREVVLFLASHKEITPSRNRCQIPKPTTTINIQNTCAVPGFDSPCEEDFKEEESLYPNGLLVIFQKRTSEGSYEFFPN